jgi:cell wall-associated NlpC family hydrolase
MNSFQKISVGTLFAVGLFSFPSIIAHADEGVVTHDFSIKDASGNVIKEFKANEVVYLDSEDQENYQIMLNGQRFPVKKSFILKTIRYEEESLTVEEDGVTLKSSPDLFGSVLQSLNKGETVYRIKEVAEQGEWVKVRTSQSVEGWVYKSSLKPNIKKIPVTTKAFIDDDSQREKRLYYGDEISIVGFENNQYKAVVDGKQVFVDPSAVSFSKPPKRIIRPIVKPRVNFSGKKVFHEEYEERAISHNENLADRLIDEAYKYLGTPYVWGGTTPNGFDCSGFTQYVSRKVGIYLPRVASDQARVGEYVDRNELRKGDFVFFETYKEGPSHIGIYIGNNRFIHAGGDRVHISNLNTPYYAERYLFAKRMF